MTTTRQGRVTRLLEVTFRIGPEQLARVLLMLVYAMCAYGGAFVVGATISSSLFLARLPSEYIPYRYVLTGIGIVVATMSYRRIEGGFRRDRIVLLANAVYLLCIFVLRYLIGLYPVSFAPLALIVIFNDAVQVLVSIQVWNLASDLFDGREAKRFFGLIAGGAVLSYLVIGAVVRAVLTITTAPNLLFVYAGTVGASMISVALIGRHGSRRLDEARVTGPRVPTKKSGVISDLRRLGRSHLLIAIGALLALKLISALVVDFQMSITLKESSDEPGIAVFWATFSIWCGISACVVQFFVANRLIERLGLLPAILLLPCFLVIGMVTVVLTRGAFWAVTFSRAGNPVFGWLFSSTLGLLYVPVPNDFRPRARALNEGVIAPVVVGATALLLVALVRVGLSVNQIAAMVLGALLLQIGVSILVQRHYLAGLTRTLERRALDFDRSALSIEDPRTRAVLSASLRGDDPERIVHVLDIIEDLGGGAEWDAEVAALVAHPEPWVRVRTIRYLGRKGNSRWKSSVLECLETSEPEIVAEAIQSYCAMEADDIPRVIHGFMSHTSPLVKRAAADGLLRHGGVDGALLVGGEVRRMLDSRDAVVRAEGARLLGGLGDGFFGNWSLPRLLEDESLDVRRAAIEAMGATRDRQYLPALVARLRDRRTELQAAHAIARIGPGIEPELAEILCAGEVSQAVRAHLLGILSRIDTQAAADLLLENLDRGDEGQRGAAALGLAKLKERLPSARIDHERLDGVLLKEGRRALEWHAIQGDLGVTAGASLLLEILSFRLRRCEDRIYDLLGARYQRRDVRLIVYNLQSGAGQRRTNALDLLESLLSHELKQLLLPLLEGGSARDALMKSRQATLIPHRSPEDWVDVLLATQDEWLTICTLHHVGARSLVQHAPAVRRLLESATPEIVRESARWALARLPAVEVIGHSPREPAGDAGSSGLRAAPEATQSAAPSPEATIGGAALQERSVLDLVLFLKGVDLFSAVSIEDLATIARLTAAVTFAPGDLIMRQGDIGSCLLLLVSGEARVLIDGTEVRRVGRTDCLGELAILDAQPRSASVVASTEVAAIRIERADFLEFIAPRGEMLRGVIGVLVSRLRDAPGLDRPTLGARGSRAAGQLMHPHQGNEQESNVSMSSSPVIRSSHA